MTDYLVGTGLPYCKGCGHHLIVRNTVKALETLDGDPLDVVLVTDIGCQGIADRSFATHTIHGLHGRSVALASGLAMGVAGQKHVLVFIGDGGATIGLQHLLEAARLNVDLTVVVHNNMLYGMTGGQPSGLTPRGFRTVITADGSPYPHHDLCRLVHDAGAPHAQRVLGLGDFSPQLREAMTTEGFALVEVLELCPSHGLKMNPDLRLRRLAEEADYGPRVWRGEKRAAFRLPANSSSSSLLEQEHIAARVPRSRSALERRLSVVLGGSAGEGAQRAAELFAQAAVSSGLCATKKGSYPVTVGVGFSTAEVIISPDPILYHGISQPDVVIVTSGAGLAHNRERIEAMTDGVLWIDKELSVPHTGADVRTRGFRERAGARNAALHALLTFVSESEVVPMDAMVSAIRASSIAQYVPESLINQVEDAGDQV